MSKKTALPDKRPYPKHLPEGRSSKDLRELVPSQVSPYHMSTPKWMTPYKLHLLVVVAEVQGCCNAPSIAANGPTKLVSWLMSSSQARPQLCWTKAKNKETDVPPERRHVGLTAINAMDALKPGDIAIFTTPCAFRWVHFAKAIEKSLHVFMEKPVTPDGFSSRKMLELNEKAKAKKLKVGVGLMCRHSRARRELHARIQDGELGDLLLLRACHAATYCIMLLERNQQMNLNTLYQSVGPQFPLAVWRLIQRLFHPQH